MGRKPTLLLLGAFAIALGTTSTTAAQVGPTFGANEPPKFTARMVGATGFGELRLSHINDKGDTVSTFTTWADPGRNYTRTDAFFRRGSTEGVPLGHLPGGFDNTRPRDLNDHGWVVGSSHTGVDTAPNWYGTDHAVVWNDRDGLIDLGVLPGGRTSSANGINNHNHVVGFSDAATRREAFVWRPGGGMRALPVPAAAGTSTAEDINDKGTVVGHVYLRGASMLHATLWTPSGGIRDLGELAGGLEESVAYAVNEKDHVVGYSLTRAGHRAFFWSEEGGMIDLGALPESSWGSAAYGINEVDWVVGTSRSPGTTLTGKPFLWTPLWGLRDLNELLAEGFGDWRLYEASWVGDGGDILAIGQSSQDFGFVLLSPIVPEPTTAGLVAAAAFASCIYRRGVPAPAVTSRESERARRRLAVPTDLVTFAEPRRPRRADA